eukprot:scaffold7836_cov17-Tisochrysis_lutea.AAC.3
MLAEHVQPLQFFGLCTAFCPSFSYALFHVSAIVQTPVIHVCPSGPCSAGHPGRAHQQLHQEHAVVAEHQQVCVCVVVSVAVVFVVVAAAAAAAAAVGVACICFVGPCWQSVRDTGKWAFPAVTVRVDERRRVPLGYLQGSEGTLNAKKGKRTLALSLSCLGVSWAGGLVLGAL